MLARLIDQCITRRCPCCRLPIRGAWCRGTTGCSRRLWCWAHQHIVSALTALAKADSRKGIIRTIAPRRNHNVTELCSWWNAYAVDGGACVAAGVGRCVAAMRATCCDRPVVLRVWWVRCAVTDASRQSCGAHGRMLQDRSADPVIVMTTLAHLCEGDARYVVCSHLQQG